MDTGAGELFGLLGLMLATAFVFVVGAIIVDEIRWSRKRKRGF